MMMVPDFCHPLMGPTTKKGASAPMAESRGRWTMRDGEGGVPTTDPSKQPFSICGRCVVVQVFVDA